MPVAENILNRNFMAETVGERTAVNPNPKSSFIPDNFEIFTDEACTIPAGNKISVKVNEFLYIYLGNFTPADATHVQNSIVFKAYDDKGNLLITNEGTKYDSLQFFRCDKAIGYFNCVDGAIGGKSLVFCPSAEGNYTYEIYLDGTLLYTLTIYANKVNAPKVEVGENQFAVQTLASFTANKATFVADVAGTYTFTFEDNLIFTNADEYDAAFDEKGNVIGEYTVYYDFQDPFGEKTNSFEVDLDAGETIRFYVTSDKAGVFVLDYSVN